MKRSLKGFAIFSMITITLVGCNESTPTVSKPIPKAETAQAEMINSQGAKVGKAEFYQDLDGVKVKIEISQLSAGKHGMHIHTIGKCETPNFTSAGAHFNPDSKKHGTQNNQGPHAGDLPNLEINAKGEGKAEFLLKNITLKENQPNSLLKANGTSIVIHEKEDDYQTDPSGNSGGRIACGEIK